MAKMAHAGKNHRYSCCIGRRNYLIVTEGATGLNNGAGPGQ